MKGLRFRAWAPAVNSFDEYDIFETLRSSTWRRAGATIALNLMGRV